jgi:hypothetical protein
MIHRLALAVASAAAALTFAFALALAALAPAPGQLVARSIGTTVPVASDSATSDPSVQVDTIYIEAPPPPQIVTVHRTVRIVGEQGEHESGGDD